MMDAKQHMANHETAKLENDNLITGDTGASHTSHQKDEGFAIWHTPDEIWEFWKTFSESRSCWLGFLKCIEEGTAELDLIKLKQLQEDCKKDPILLGLWFERSLQFSADVWNHVAYRLLNNLIKLINRVITGVFEYFETESYPADVDRCLKHRW